MEESTNNVKSSKKASRQKIVQAILKYIVIILGMSFTLYLLWSIGNFIYSQTISKEIVSSSTKDTYAKIEKKTPLMTYSLGNHSFPILNRATGDIEFYIKLDLMVAYKAELETLSEELDNRKTQIEDMLRDVVSRKSYNDINNMDKLEDLKIEIKARLNNILTEGEISEIYFNSLSIVQGT